MKAQLVGTDAYLEQWTRTSAECGDDLDGEARDEAHRIETEYDSPRLERLVAGMGIEEDV